MNKSKQLFNNNVILDSLEQSIFVKNIDSVYLFANKAYADLINKTPFEIIGKNDFDLFPKEIAQKYRNDDIEIIKDDKIIDIEEEILINNEIRVIRTIKKPTYSDGKIVAIIGIFWDITKEKEEEKTYKKLQSGLMQAQALANIGHWELDLITNNLYWSDEVYRIFGLKAQEFDATYEAFLGYIYPDDVELVNNSYINSIEEKRGYHVKHRIVRENGEIGFVEERCEHEFNVDGRPVRSIGTVHDITNQKLAQNKLLLASAVFEKMTDGVLITDSNQRILSINRAFSKLSGYTIEEIKGKTPRIFSSGWHDKSFYKNVWDVINTKGQWSGEIIDRKKNGETFTSELEIMSLFDDDGILTNYISIINDISEKKQQEDIIHNLAYYDSLTNLPNKVLFHERVSSRIPALKRNLKRMALLFIDMDNFKNINDTLGHFMGDKFLKEVAKSIKALIREQDTLARLGGDEFAIMIEEVDSIIDIVFIANKLIDRFSLPIEVEDKKLYTGVSIGISIYPDDGKTYEELVKAADTAMYQVKENGKNNYRFYTKIMNDKIIRRVYIENDMRSSISNNELFLEYQPQINTDTKSIYGMEALIRWNHPDKGLIRPDEFISIAEDTGQIAEITSWVIKQAVSDTKKLHDNGFKLIVSINISSKQLQDGLFIDDICAIVDEIGLDKSYIDLEITETHIMNNIDKALLVLNELSTRGFKLSIDDFGTGYSSLSYLKKLPAKTIKIDRSFVLDIDTDNDGRCIVAAIIAMAKSLDKDVIAEGSETKGHIETLKYLHCNKIQGYYYSRPLPIERFKEFIDNFEFKDVLI